VLIWIVGIAFAIGIIQKHAQVELFAAVGPLRDVGVIACIVWFLVGFVSRVQTNMIDEKLAHGGPFDRTTAEAVGKLLRVAVIVTGVLVALQTLGYSISGVLALGGIGGLATGFAAKDMLANFFGGLMIYMDRPFSVGDWIRVQEQGVEGTVEAIGWRLTRIRTFDQRPIYVPNALFMQAAVENPSRMTNRRIFETIGLRYDDADKIGRVVADVDKMLRAHRGIDQNQTLMVAFDKFAASSLDFFVYCFTLTTAWAEYQAIKQDVLLRILDIVAQHGAQIAFPTSTIHVPDAVHTAPADAATASLAARSTESRERRNPR